MITCQVVVIRFMDRNDARQEISASHVTGAVKLRVHRDDSFVSIDCVTEDGKLVKEINFSLKDVKEYTCDRIIWGVK